MDIASNIKAIRKARGITPTMMAKELGIEATNYPRLENRGNQLTFNNLEKISKALRVSVVELITWGGIQSNENPKETSNGDLGEKTQDSTPTVLIAQEYIETLKRKLALTYSTFIDTISNIGENAGIGTEHIEDENEVYIMFYRTFTNSELMQVYDIIYANHSALYYVFRDLFQRDIIDTTTREAKLFLKHYNRKLGAIPH